MKINEFIKYEECAWNWNLMEGLTLQLTVWGVTSTLDIISTYRVSQMISGATPSYTYRVSMFLRERVRLALTPIATI